MLQFDDEVEEISTLSVWCRVHRTKTASTKTRRPIDLTIRGYWDDNTGSDAGWVAEELSRDAVKIVPNLSSFAALKLDGSVVAWGNSTQGGDSTDVEDEFPAGASEIYGNRNGVGFAALRADTGGVVIPPALPTACRVCQCPLCEWQPQPDREVGVAPSEVNGLITSIF